jgi:hypothetical protein
VCPVIQLLLSLLRFFLLSLLLFQRILNILVLLCVFPTDVLPRMSADF